MTLPAPAATCANHRKREQVAICASCGDGLCVDCVVHTFVGIKCGRCTGTGPAAKRSGRTGPPAARSSGPVAEARHAGPRRRWAVPAAAVGVLMVVGAGLALVRGGGDDGAGGRAESGADEDVTPTQSVTERVGDFTGAGGLKIGATLTVPAGVGANPVSGVVIVPGRATIDRNGLRTPQLQSDPLYEDLSKALAEAGMASLRYDRRGSGQSALAPWEALSFEDLIIDARSGLDFLAQRRETSGAPLGLIAYDHGGFVAMSLAAADPRVKSVVLISTPGRPVVDVMADDFIREVPDQGRGLELANALRAAAAEVVSTGQVPPQETLPPELRPLFAPDDAAFLRGLFTFEPTAEAPRIAAATLVVRGGNDTSITDLDVTALRQSLRRSESLVSPSGGNTLALPPGQEGVFHNPARHGTTRDGDALTAITNWLEAHLVA